MLLHWSEASQHEYAGTSVHSLVRMDALCAYTPRCACHVSFTSPNSASTSKYSPGPGHRLLRTQQYCGPRSRHSWFPQASANSAKRLAASPDFLSSRDTSAQSSWPPTPPTGSSVPERAFVSNSQRLVRCTLYGFTAAAVLTFTLPDPSYSAEALPIELLRTWVVSTVSQVISSTVTELPGGRQQRMCCAG